MKLRGIQQLFHIGYLKTLWFNFRYLPFKQAIKIPVMLARDVSIRECWRGGVLFDNDKPLHPGILRIGFGDSIHNPYQKSSILVRGKLIIHGTGLHSFCMGTKLNIEKNGILEIGDNFSASANNKIRCDCHIKIGDDNMWSYDNILLDTDAHQITDNDGNILNHPKSIEFGNHVWLGCGCIVLKGSKIPNGCIVASGSKIMHQYDEVNSIITTGKKIIKRNIIWNRNISV